MEDVELELLGGTDKVTNKNSTDVFWRTIIGNRSSTHPGNLTAAELKRLPTIMSSWLQVPIDANSRFEPPDPRKSGILERLSNTLGGRCLCLTKEGYLGVVGGSSLPGDVVCVVQGAPVPMVLRESDFRQEAKEKGIELYILGNV